MFFLLAFVFLYFIYGKPSSPCKIKFPEMYSLIFFSETRPILVPEPRVSLSGRISGVKSTRCDRPSSQRQGSLCSYALQKRGKCEYIRPWMMLGNCYLQTGSRRKGGGYGDPSVLMNVLLLLWHGPEWTEEQIPCMVHKSQNALWSSETTQGETH